MGQLEMMRSFAIMIFFLLSAIPAYATEFKIEGAVVKLASIEGFCELPRDDDFGRDYYSKMERVQNKGNNSVIVTLVLCDRMNSIRQGDRNWGEWATWVVLTSNGKIRHLGKQVSRSDFLGALATSIPKISISVLEERGREILESNELSLDIQEAGIIDQDTNAVYIGTLSKFGAEDTYTVNVGSMTLLGDLAIGFHTYKQTGTAADYNGLLSRVKGVIAETIRNP